LLQGTPKDFSFHNKINITLITIKTFDKGKGITLLRGWKERSGSSAMAKEIFKRIVPIEEISPLER